MNIVGNVPQSLVAFLQRHSSKVREVYAGDGYATDSGRAYDILLERGWCEGDLGLHTIIEPTIKDVRDAFTRVERCQCNDCISGNGW